MHGAVCLYPQYSMVDTEFMDNTDLFDSIDTLRIRLRCPRRDDAATIAGLVTPGVSRWLAAWFAPMTEQAAEIKIFNARQDISAGLALHFLLERLEDQAVMGWIRVSRSDTLAWTGDLGYWLNETYHHSGYITEAAFAALVAAFECLHLDSVEGGAQIDNTASFAVMRRLGMQPCGERMVWAPARNRNELCFFYSVTRDKFIQFQTNRQVGKIALA